MIEREKTYLAKSLPAWLEQCRKKQIVDRYMPATDVHPWLRLRHHDDTYELTKKRPIVDGDASTQLEQTISLNADEYAILAMLPAKQVSKTRYYLDRDEVTYEIDVFEEWLQGLVLVEVEFATEAEKEAFVMPEFCLVEVTQDDFIAGGMLCGKSYDSLAPLLAQYGYTPLTLH